jgi:hypothetical protein
MHGELILQGCAADFLLLPRIRWSSLSWCLHYIAFFREPIMQLFNVKTWRCISSTIHSPEVSLHFCCWFCSNKSLHTTCLLLHCGQVNNSAHTWHLPPADENSHVLYLCNKRNKNILISLQVPALCTLYYGVVSTWSRTRMRTMGWIMLPSPA